MDHRETRNQAGDRRTVRSVATGEERQVSYREAVGLVSRRRAEWVQDKPKPTRKPPQKKRSAEAVYADPETPIETAGSGRSDVTKDPAPLKKSKLPSPTDTGAAADSGSSEDLPTEDPSSGDIGRTSPAIVF